MEETKNKENIHIIYAQGQHKRAWKQLIPYEI